MEEKVRSMINRIRPILNLDGGDVMFIDIDNGIVRICLTGFVCGVKAMEKYIKKEIPEVKSVENII
jgi:Fe-S cluster biogenesis protein NfuA